MTITESIAANDIADEVLRMVRDHGATITPKLERGIYALLINANIRLTAGYTRERFSEALFLARNDAAKRLPE